MNQCGGNQDSYTLSFTYYKNPNICAMVFIIKVSNNRMNQAKQINQRPFQQKVTIARKTMPIFIPGNLLLLNKVYHTNKIMQ